MKKRAINLSLCSIFLLFHQFTSAQIFGGFARRVTNKVADKAAEKTAEKIVESMDIDSISDKDQLPKDYQIEMTGKGEVLHLEYVGFSISNSSSNTAKLDMNLEIFTHTEKGSRTNVTIELPIIRDYSASTIFKKEQPKQIVYLDNRKESYIIKAITDVNKQDSNFSYTLKKIGQEKLLGLNCIHVQLIATILSEDTIQQTYEIWTTKDFPQYNSVMESYTNVDQMGTNKLWNKMQEENCEGIMVKIIAKTDKGRYALQLKNIEKSVMPKNLFNIPSNYKQKKN